MSNPMQRQLSQKKQVKSALERIDQIEEDIPQIVLGVNDALLELRGELRNRISPLAQITEALTEILGSDIVDAKIKEIDQRKTMARVETAKKNLEDGLAKGTVVKADAISDKSLIVGRETDKDGQVIFPGRAQLTFDKVAPEFQDKLLGQGVGFQVDTQTGGKFEVVEVYDVVTPPPAQPSSAPATETVEA